jgi:4-alpha-glucanotransferase
MLEKCSSPFSSSAFAVSEAQRTSASTQGAAASAVRQLAERCGIEDAYVDARGRTRRTSLKTAAALLAAMGYRLRDGDDARRIIDELEAREWTRPLPPVTVHRSLGPPAVVVTLPAAARHIVWRVVLEDGRRLRRRVRVRELEILGKKVVRGSAYARVRLLLTGEFPCGYHTLHLEPDGSGMPLLVAPPKCWLPPKILLGSRLWGLTAQLYLLRSSRNWGSGDFGDLRTLVDISKRLGADVLGLNPLHAMFPDDPEHASPYSPASRLLLNVLSIDVGQLAQHLKIDDASRLIASRAFRAQLAACRRAKHVRYAEVSALKLRALRTMFEAIGSRRRSSAWRAFERFERESSEAVKRACLFLALRDYFSVQAPELANWRRWPQEFRDPQSQAVRTFSVEHADRVAFQLWLQYVADLQLGAAAEAAAPMAIGLYRDLAVGADAAGAETWANQRSVVSAAHVGAPPDIYNPAGQDWGLPPFNPRALREEGYRGFIDLVRANMRHAGGLRVDHVMALRHLYWVPEGESPEAGAYVGYPIDDLIGILALESHRHRCIVVGEDLGTVPAGFRECMAAANILSYRVLLFERDDQGFLPPGRYPELALAVASSHDLPTLRAWWERSDLELKSRLRLYPARTNGRTAMKERERDRAQLRQALRREGLAPRGVEAEALFEAAHAFLARSPCALATAQLDDATDELHPVNVPGTADEYPNWRRRLSLTLDQIARSRRLARLAEVFNRERRARRMSAPARIRARIR